MNDSRRVGSMPMGPAYCIMTDEALEDTLLLVLSDLGLTRFYKGLGEYRAPPPKKNQTRKFRQLNYPGIIHAMANIQFLYRVCLVRLLGKLVKKRRKKKA